MPHLPASPLTSTAALVREFLLASKGAPQRMAALFDHVRGLGLPVSRTHFRESVVRPMFARGELRKLRVVPAAPAAAAGTHATAGRLQGHQHQQHAALAALRPFFGITLAPSAKVRRLVAESRASKLPATLAAVAAAAAATKGIPATSAVRPLGAGAAPAKAPAPAPLR